MAHRTFEIDYRDWINDSDLRSLSFGARGLWIDLQALMHDSKPRGYLQDRNGRPLTAHEIAIKVEGRPATVSRLLAEIAAEGVSSINDVGVIYCRHLAAQDGPRATPEPKAEKSAKDRLGARVGALRSLPSTELMAWLDWWNGLHDAKMVKAGVSTNPPSQAVVTAWLKAKANPERCALLFAEGQRPKIFEAIAKSPHCRSGWFRLEVLLNGCNKNNEMIVAALLDGAYAAETTPSDSALREQGREKLAEARRLRGQSTPGSIPADIVWVIQEMGGWRRFADNTSEYNEREFVRLWMRYMKTKGVA